MLSSLSKGYGHWDNGQVDLYQKDYKVESSVLPAVEGTETHRHGITVSGRNTAMSTVGAKTPGSRTKDLSIEGKLNLPKTFSTRKGALQLFTAPEDLVTEEKDQNKYAQAQRPRYVQVQRMGGKDLIDLSLKLGTLERLSKSVLQFGDQDDFDKDKTSISDEKNKLFLKFLHSIDNEQDADTHLRPGGDLSVYLRDLKTRASSRFYSEGTMYVPKSRESQELQAILRGLDSNWPLSFPQDNFSDRRSAISEQFTRPVSRVSSRGPSPGPPSTPRSTYQVLSTKKLAASIKSSNYLGRPSSTLSMFEDETLTDFDRCGTSSPQPVTHASVNKKKWSPTDSTGGSLASGSLAGSELDSDDERKRTRHRDYSSGLLFQVDEDFEDDASSKRKGSRITDDDSERKSFVGDVLGDLAALNLLPKDHKTSTKGKKKGADKKSKSGSIKSGLSSDGDKPGSPDYKLVLASDRLQAKEEKLVIPDHLTDALGRRPSKSYEALEKDLERRGFLKDGKVTDIVDSTLSGPTLQAVGEGLSTEEFELAKKILQSRLAEAQEKLDDPGTQKKKKGAKTSAKGKGKKGKKKGEGEDNDVDREQEEIRKKQQEEQQRRDAEAKELQRKIAERRALLKNQENLANEKSREIREEMERLEREADAMAMAEEDAKQALADVRKKQREEREVRRKADLERKKQQAVDRREQEKKQLEESRKKEMEMLETIADAEMRRRLREEEERKMYEEDRLAQERLEDELMLAAQDAEDEEERRQEAERQAEEEALDRFRIQQEEADRQTRKLRDERERMEEEEMQRRDYMLMEQRKLEEERTRQREQEDARRELERQHLVELRRLEDEARQKMMEELDKRRNEALTRRDVNLENRNHVDKMKHYQGITRPWTFSYFVRWARDSYERPMGGALDKKKRLRPRPAPPKPAEVPVETLEANPDTNTAT